MGLSPGELGVMAHFGNPLALPTPHDCLAHCSLPVSAVSVESPWTHSLWTHHSSALCLPVPPTLSLDAKFLF